MNPRRRRIALLVATGLVHAALLTWMGLQTPRPNLSGEGRSLTVGLFDASALQGAEVASVQAQASEAPAEPPEPTPEIEEAIVDPLGRGEPIEPSPESLSAVNFSADPVAVGDGPASPSFGPTGAEGESCGLEGRLQAVLDADPLVRRAVAAIPNEKRSVSNAVMLWNGRWMAVNRDTDAIRAAVTAYVAAAPAACRNEAVSGPMLLAIAGEPKTTILVVGSGLWRWADLLADDPR